MRRIKVLAIFTAFCLLLCQAGLADRHQGTFTGAVIPTQQLRAGSAEAPAAETPAEEALAEDIQYVLFLGTNDKDTNKPVFTQAESLEQAKAILVKHFGGYTIQEAQGGWLDGDKLYQEYTLVIYLSDTTREKVHAAADELVETFRQSSVMIQANPTKTEFYSGK